MNDAPTVQIKTTFFVSGPWSLVETVDFKLKILQQGKAVEKCEWPLGEMGRAVAAYRRLCGHGENGSKER